MILTDQRLLDEFDARGRGRLLLRDRRPARFRVTPSASAALSIALRAIPFQIRTIEELNAAPGSVRSPTPRGSPDHRATGTGKSTTMAAMLAT